MGLESRIGVSSATFFDLSNAESEGKKIVSSYVKGGIHAPEVARTIEAAKKFGIGMELVYRKNLVYLSPQITESNVEVFQMHGSTARSIPNSIKQSLEEHPPTEGLGAFINLIESPVIAWAAMGTLKGDWDYNVYLALLLGVSQIVVHPYGADYLQKTGLIEVAKNRGVTMAIEPDFKRLKESSSVIWDQEKVLAIAQKTGEGICMDTSHTIITTNNLASLSEAYHFYKQAPKGVKAIHVSAAVPGEHRQAFFTQATGAMPLYQDESIIPSNVRGAYAEFIQEVANDPDFDGPIIIELFSFPKGRSFGQRIKAVEETLNSLLGFVSNGGSLSFPGQPTARPI